MRPSRRYFRIFSNILFQIFETPIIYFILLWGTLVRERMKNTWLIYHLVYELRNDMIQCHWLYTEKSTTGIIRGYLISRETNEELAPGFEGKRAILWIRSKRGCRNKGETRVSSRISERDPPGSVDAHAWKVDEYSGRYSFFFPLQPCTLWSLAI